MRQVVHDFIVQKNKLGEAITPVYLYSIQYDETTNSWIRYSGMGRDIIFGGEVYQKRPIVHGAIKENTSGMLASNSVEIADTDKEIQYYLKYYNGLKKKKLLLTITYLETLDNPDCFLEYEYEIDNSTRNDLTVILNLSNDIESLGANLPKRVFDPNRCQVCGFKDEDCGYSGPVSKCNRTQNDCLALGNIGRFGGFPGVTLTLGKIK